MHRHKHTSTHTHTFMHTLSARTSSHSSLVFYIFRFSLLLCCRWLAFYVNNIKFNILYIERVLYSESERKRERESRSRATTQTVSQSVLRMRTYIRNITIVIVFRLTLSQCSECEKHCMRRRLCFSQKDGAHT